MRLIQHELGKFAGYVMMKPTPDSFSDGGKYDHIDTALFRVEQMLKEGADLIDIGGESTRPGYQKISEEMEIQRTVSVIELIKAKFDIPVSIDTYKPKVATAALQAGADLVNDIWGLKFDPALAEVIANENIACCLMHNRKEAVYQNYMEEVLWDLEETLQIAHQAGIADDKIMLDPGVGFGKTYEHNLEIIDRMEMLHSLGYPLLLGASRKSVVGNALNLPKEERVEGTLVTSVFAVLKRAMFVRVHDVKENARAIRMAEAIRDGYR